MQSITLQRRHIRLGMIRLMSLLERAEHRRVSTLAGLDQNTQEAQEQYFTPKAAAEIMAALPRMAASGTVKILDPGAGSGVLTAAIVERFRRECPAVSVEVTAVESDPALVPVLEEALEECREAGAKTYLVTDDFVDWALSTETRYDIVIQNPPYAKLPAKSDVSLRLKAHGIAVPNIYAAFMSLGARLLTDGGQQVSITPRSWMNGTYYSAFRRGYVKDLSLDAIHTFESRSKVFGDTGVLQESIIVSATKAGSAETITLFQSLDHEGDVTSRSVPYDHVVSDDFLYVPANQKDGEAVSWMASHALCKLEDLGIKVSTGRVVDFRSREYLSWEATPGSAPAIYPANIQAGVVNHPLSNAKKPQWFTAPESVQSKMLVPAGSYVLVKRFSAKEERRRIVACVWSGGQTPAFDNKLNYFHRSAEPLEPLLAQGLMKWLNSSRVDHYFRVFSGHTQVNAGDLRMMSYPTLNQLRELAESTDEVDAAVEKILTSDRVAA